MLPVEIVKETKAYKNTVNKISQYSYYENNGAAPEILKIVNMESKAFGALIEKVLIEHYELDKRVNTQHDARIGEKKLEIKAARYWAGKDECKWQHIEQGHDYDFILFALVDFNSIKCWIAKKEVVCQHMTPQGLQGNWVDKSTILQYLTEVTSKEELFEFVKL